MTVEDEQRLDNGSAKHENKEKTLISLARVTMKAGLLFAKGKGSRKMQVDCDYFSGPPYYRPFINIKIIFELLLVFSKQNTKRKLSSMALRTPFMGQSVCV
jgi:hypothetical protein